MNTPFVASPRETLQHLAVHHEHPRLSGHRAFDAMVPALGSRRWVKRLKRIVQDAAAENATRFSQLFLCLSGACLGKTIVSMQN
jgi:hypothetical protein